MSDNYESNRNYPIITNLKKRLWCKESGGRVSPCFVAFAKELRGARTEENSSLLDWDVAGPRVEVIPAKSAGK